MVALLWSLGPQIATLAVEDFSFSRGRATDLRFLSVPFSLFLLFP
jgi:hypothetical protein